METRTGMMPVCGAMLLCILTILSVRAWQGADLAAEFRGLSGGISIASSDSEFEAVRDDLRLDLGFAHSRSPVANQIEQIAEDSLVQSLRYSDDFEHSYASPRKLNQLLELQPSIFQTTTTPRIASEAYEEDFDQWFDQIASTAPLESESPIVPPRSEFISTAANPSPALTTNHLASVPEPPSQPEFELLEPEHIGTVSNTEPIEKADSEKTGTIESNSASEQIKKTQAWTIPHGLIRELKVLFRNPMTAAWAHSTVQIIESLEHLNDLSDDNISIVVGQLSKQLEQLDFLSVQLSAVAVNDASLAQGELASQLSQIRYSIQRRLQIWPVVHELSKRKTNRIGLVEGHQVGQFLLASSTRLNSEGVEKGWSEYLKLPEATSVFNSLNPNAFAKKKAARQVLARLFSPSLNYEQQKYLQTAVDEQAVDILRVSATDHVDLEQFLNRIEKMEFRKNGASQFYLNDSYQSLLWSDDPGYHELASRLQTHYRNANFRVSVSDALLNRMIPKMPVTQEPYRDRIMGADVVGQNRISNQIRVSLIPDPDQISMKLETFGNVKSRTTATRSGIVVENEGTSRFRVIKRLAFGQQGIFAYRPETTSQVAQRVVGLRSNLDNVPALGWMVRKIAKNKIAEQAPVTKRYTQHQLETKAETKFDQEIEIALNELEDNLTRNLLHPLIAMDLEPDPVEISTTTNRVNMRYRLAGRDQMAANTARPRGVQDCLLSMQIHESAINNTISRFELAGRKLTTQELLDYINQAIGEDFVLASETATRKEAKFEFAPFDPVRIQFEEQKISLTINLKSFQIGNGKRWKNLVIKSTYDPFVVAGFNVGLIQSEEGLRIKGKRLNVGDQLAIGMICEVLFPEQFQIPMIPAGIADQLKITNAQTNQFVVSNGWIGLSVDDPQVQQIDRTPYNQAQQSRPFGRQRQR